MIQEGDRQPVHNLDEAIELIRRRAGREGVAARMKQWRQQRRHDYTCGTWTLNGMSSSAMVRSMNEAEAWRV